MNLLIDPVFPVLTKSGLRKTISFHQITDPDLLCLDFTRADFNSAGLLFLIGVVQTAIAPTNGQWQEGLKQPPDLKQVVKDFQKYFEVTGKDTDPLFMQDQEPDDLDKIWPVSNLLFDSPRNKTVEDGTDFYRKDGDVANLCPRCAALTIYNCQTRAWPNGGGYFTAPLSSPAPLAILFLNGPCLWETVWLNVIDQEKMQTYGSGSLIFPWASKRQSVCPKNCSPYHIYWTMPWRLRFNVERIKSVCDICSAETDTVIKSVRVKNHGSEYRGWKHPLVAYNKKNTPCCISPDMKGLLQNIKTLPETFVHQADSVTVCGPIMGNSKFLGWVERTLPRMQADEWRLSILRTVSNFLHKNILAIPKMDDFYDRAMNELLFEDCNSQAWLDKLQIAAFDLFDSYTSQTTHLNLRDDVRNRLKKFFERLYMKNELTPVDSPDDTLDRSCHTEWTPIEISSDTLSGIASWWAGLRYRSRTLQSLRAVRHFDGDSLKEMKQEPGIMSFMMVIDSAPEFDLEDRDHRAVILAMLLAHVADISGVQLYPILKNEGILQKPLDQACWSIMVVLDRMPSVSVADLVKTIVNWKTTF